VEPDSLVTLGRYRVERELGRGGMSVVYRGFDPALSRVVAIKVLHPHLASRPEARERFAREARAVARLDHPNIVAVFDYAPPDSERAYIVTEYIDGPTLRSAIEPRPLTRPEIGALLMIPVFEALDHAHHAGIVHRDVKPENVMLRGDGQPVLVDFGIAQLIDMETLTQTGTILGSPAHMAPEVVDGADADGRADLFSAATVLYWLVCGVLPFTGPNPAALFRRILECKFDPVLHRKPTAGRGLARLIEQCLERDPRKRPDRGRDVADRLRALLAEVGITQIDAELAAFARDRSGYERDFGPRIIPPLLAAATTALEQGHAARAADLIDRVLGIDEQRPEARALLARLERTERRGRAVRGTGLVVLLGGAIAAASVVLPPLFIDAETPVEVVDTVPTPTLDVTAPTTVAPSAAAAPPPARPSSAATVAPSVSPSAGPSRPPRPARPRELVSAPSSVPGRPVRVPFQADLWNTEVFVDGARHGYLYEVRRNGGILLSPGRHEVTFKHPACESSPRALEVPADKETMPPVVYRCSPLPARLRVASNRTFAVRRASTGELLGQTNAEILIPLTALREDLRLTVGEPGGSLQTREVRLAAGTTTTETIEF
jgi:serine/threonine-protein kinase